MMATEKRLIDANALDGILKDFESRHQKSCFVLSAKAIANTRQIVYAMKTVDAVEVVRCKDCKHWHEETGWCIHHSHFIGSKGEACHPWESNDWKMLDADAFCSYGERKDNGI